MMAPARCRRNCRPAPSRFRRRPRPRRRSSRPEEKQEENSETKAVTESSRRSPAPDPEIARRRLPPKPEPEAGAGRAARRRAHHHRAAGAEDRGEPVAAAPAQGRSRQQFQCDPDLEADRGQPAGAQQALSVRGAGAQQQGTAQLAFSIDRRARVTVAHPAEFGLGALDKERSNWSGARNHSRRHPPRFPARGSTCRCRSIQHALSFYSSTRQILINAPEGPLAGTKQTWRENAVSSAFDPMLTFAGRS